jgi:hypothetical protein
MPENSLFVLDERLNNVFFSLQVKVWMEKINGPACLFHGSVIKAFKHGAYLKKLLPCS